MLTSKMLWKIPLSGLDLFRGIKAKGICIHAESRLFFFLLREPAGKTSCSRKGADCALKQDCSIETLLEWVQKAQEWPLAKLLVAAGASLQPFPDQCTSKTIQLLSLHGALIATVWCATSKCDSCSAQHYRPKIQSRMCWSPYLSLFELHAL